MPIEVQGGPLRVFTQDEFHDIDRAAMRIVFDVHNEFGRFLDEVIYKREIAARCAQSGIPTRREVRIHVTHESFHKEYSIDAVFSHGVIYEMKAVEWLAPVHDAQALNYVLLAGTRHAKLVKFRTERVQWRFVSTRLTPETRKDVTIDDSQWRVVDERSAQLKQCMVDLITDWGAFLACNLYRDALACVLGDKAPGIRRIPIYSDQQIIGDQEAHLSSERVAFTVTAVTESPGRMRTHLARFLAHTRLDHLQWINLNHRRIEFITLSR